MQFSCSIRGLVCCPLRIIQRIALPATQRAIEVFRERAERKVPLIHYAKGSGHLHESIRSLDIDALSLDWRDDLRANRTSFGDRFAFQGQPRPFPNARLA